MSRLNPGEILQFVRSKDFKFVKELASGATGQTVLLHDDIIDESFVCKKYSPAPGVGIASSILFKNFVAEIKILYRLHHPNVVRIYNYYLYPNHEKGYIIMEYVEGVGLLDYLKDHPESINTLFYQAIQGFSYLERMQVLHRDIRNDNLLVDATGLLKIIDFGFGKRAINTTAFKKSVSLNIECPRPGEFDHDEYTHLTDMYFLGYLFDRAINENGIRDFKHSKALFRMCEKMPSDRFQSLSDLELSIASDVTESPFSRSEKSHFTNFSDSLFSALAGLGRHVRFHNDLSRIVTSLSKVHSDCVLHDIVPDNSMVLNCFISGYYTYIPGKAIPVSVLSDFLSLINRCSDDKKDILLNNVLSKLKSAKKLPVDDSIDDIPF